MAKKEKEKKEKKEKVEKKTLTLGKGGKGGKGKRVKYPSRTAINLVYQPKNKQMDVMSIAMFLIFLVLLAVFTKFMVLDQIAAVNAAERAYREAEQRLAVLQAANDEFDAVENEYSRYGISYMTTEELDRQYRTVMLNVIDEKVSDNYDIRSISISGNTVTLAFQVEELREVSEIVGSLNESPFVSYVTFSTAATNDERIETRDENGNLVIETVRTTLSANITVYFKTLTQVAAEETAEEGGAVNE